MLRVAEDVTCSVRPMAIRENVHARSFNWGSAAENQVAARRPLSVDTRYGKNVGLSLGATTHSVHVAPRSSERARRTAALSVQSEYSRRSRSHASGSTQRGVTFVASRSGD